MVVCLVFRRSTGECCEPNVVYHATLNHEDGRTAEYIGCTEPEFKLRFGNHKKSFRHAAYKSETTLSKYVWNSGSNPSPNIKWKFLKKCSVYQTGNKSCDLCLSEKFFIIKNLHKKTLINKRTDIGNKCLHKHNCYTKLFNFGVIISPMSSGLSGSKRDTILKFVDDVSCMIR